MPKEKPSSQKPTHIVYNVQGDGDKSHWQRIGAAWAHADNNGFSIKLGMIPLSGRIQVRVADQAEGGAQ